MFFNLKLTTAPTGHPNVTTQWYLGQHDTLVSKPTEALEFDFDNLQEAIACMLNALGDTDLMLVQFEVKQSHQ